MTIRTLSRRMEALEAYSDSPDDLPPYVLMRVHDMSGHSETSAPRAGHDPDVARVDGHEVRRLPGETDHDLCMRAVSLHPCSDPAGVRVVFLAVRADRCR